MKNILNKALALILTLSSLLTAGLIPAQAASISDGNSNTVKVTMGTRSTFLTTVNGTTLGGEGWTYKTNDGIEGPAYCINHGLKAVPSDKELTISGQFTANPQTIGAFATGHPQRALGDFLGLYMSEYPELAGLTEAEYAYSTQIAVWATLGQLAVEGTSFLQDSETVAIPQYGSQQIRVYTATKIILDMASYWSQPLKTSMEIRNFKDVREHDIFLEHEKGLAGIAATNNESGVKVENIGGRDYYTREFTVASGTSTWRNGYFIDLSLIGAPEYTILTNENNEELAFDSSSWKIPTVGHDTWLNDNQSEYWGTFKLCIPVSTTGESGDIVIRANSTVAQYNIYLANNTDYTEQSYVIADPAYTPISAEAWFRWRTVKSIYGSVQVFKSDTSGTPLMGAVFTLEGNGQSYTGTSDRAGKIFWENLTPGNYTLTEVKAPEGFRIANPVNVSVVANEVSNATVTNESFRNFRLRKTDAQNGYPLLGATFRFEQIDGGYSTDATTGHDGFITFVGGELPFGSYRVYEVQAPAGYQKDTAVQTIDWDGRQDVLLTFKNVRTPSITLIKKDADTNETIEGAVFNVYRDGALVTTVTTNRAGEARVPDVSAGYYEFEEISAPAEYVLDSTRHGIRVDTYDPATSADPVLVVSNHKKPGLKLIKYDAETMRPLAGVVFEISRDGTSLGNFTTDSKGEINLTNAAPGTCTAKEIAAPVGFVVNPTPQTVELKAGQGTAMLVFLNQSKPGIRLVKLDAETMRPLAGARFRIERVGGSYSQELLTNTSGEIELTSLEPGAYQVTELSAPDGYVIDSASRTVQINAGDNVSFVFTNTKKPGMKLIKIDASTNQPLSGAVFRIAKIEAGTRYMDRTTDSKGEINLTGLDVGVYSVKELYAPTGYILNDREYHVETFAGQASEIVIGNKIAPSLKIIKYDAQSGKPMPGTTFEVYRDTVLIGAHTTDSKGEILLSGLTPGTYFVKEIATDDSHVVNGAPQQIEIVAGRHDTAVLVFLNQKKPGIHLVKLDSETMKPLAGATFRITRIGGGYDKEFTTGADGEIDLTKLEAGAYLVQETKAPSGYLIDDSIRIIQINPDENATFVFTDTAKPTLKLIKVDGATNQPLANATFRIAKIGDGTRYYDRTTNASGVIEMTELEPGIYSVQEIIAPSGYILNDTEYHVELFPGQTSEIVVENAVRPQLKIIKYDQQSRTPMSDTTFEVWRNAVLIGTYTTNVSGEIHLTGLDPGTYLVKEVSTDDAHVVNSTPQQIEIKAGSHDTVTLVFLNQKKPGIHLVKLDSETMQPLANATFRITKVGGSFDKEFTTDKNGEIDLSKLEPGAYQVREIKAPDGYLIDDGIRTIQINPDENAVFVFTDTKKPSIEILKYDPLLDKYLPGASFRIARINDGSNYLDRVTDTSGRIYIDNLIPGVYSVKEITAPSNYVVNETEYHVELFGGKTSRLVVIDEIKPSLKIIKSDALTGKPIAGTVFTVKMVDGKTITTVTTDENGEVLLPYLDPAVYEIIEKNVPNGYVLDTTPQYITLVPNRTGTVHFRNYPAPSLAIHKVDAITKDPIKGAKFEISYAPDNLDTGGIRSLGSYTSDADGKISLENLEPGWYRVKETAPASGYSIKSPDTQDFYLKAGENKEITFENQPKNAIIIRKVDADTGEMLPGARFTIRYASNGASGTSGTVIGEYLTSNNGTIVVTGLKAGAYIVEETRAPQGYIMVENAPQTVWIAEDETSVVEVTFVNRKEAGLLIKKMDADTKEPLADCIFKVTDSRGAVVGTSNGEYRTDEKGFIHIPNLTPGAYVVTEVQAKDGYILDNTAQTVHVEFGKLHSLEFFNKKLSGLVIKKLDNVTKKPLAGAEFKITYSDGSVIGTSNGEFITDKDGLIVINNLKSATVIVREVKAPDGYIMDDAPQTVKIEKDKTHTLTFYNNPMAGLQIHKTDSVTGKPLSGARFKVTKMNGEYVGEFTTERGGYVNVGELDPGWYTIVETKAPNGYILENTPKNVEIKTYRPVVVEFENTPAASLQILKLDEDTRKPISGVDFAVAKMNGQRIGTFTTDKYGIIEFPRLDAGWYTVTEVKAASGYMIDTSAHTVEIKDGDMAALTVTNKKAATILIKKIDSVTKRGIYGAVFLLYDENNNPIGEWTSDQDGYVWINKQLPEGRYKIREVKAADGYAIDNQIKTVYVTAGKTSEVYWENTPVQGQIIITKKSSQYNAMTNLPAGSPLAGAVFEVYDRAGNVVDKMVSDSRGVAASKPLSPSLYTVKEVSAPKFYVLNDKLLYAEIRKDGDVVRFEVLNDSVKLGVTIQKKGNSSAIAGQQIRYDLYEIQNTSTAPLQNFYIHDRLPTDAVRITKLFTGTYNQRAVYNVSFKTNYRDYRLLQDNLYNNVNYELSLNPQSLGLMEGEYVTDIRLEFGTVQPGFTSVENVTMLCDTLPNLPAGYNISNRADVGGQYAGEWIIDKASWVTIVQQGFNPKPLPKTGY